MKKIVTILLAALLALMTAACSGKPAAESSVAAGEAEGNAAEANAETEAETEAEPPLMNMPNPMVPIEFSEDFDLTISVPVKAELLSDNAEMFIIGGDTAHVAWNEEANYTFRATKNSAISETLHGIYDEKMTEPSVESVDAGNGVKVEVAVQKAPTEKFTIWSWKDGDTFYTLTADKEIQTDDAAEVLSRCMYAAGIVDLSRTIEPLPLNPVGEEVEDGIYYTDFVVRDESDAFTFELYGREYFDVVDVHEMRVGDTLLQDGYENVIETLREENGAFVVNGGLDEGGVTLLPLEGGIYYAQNMDDLPFLLDLGSAELPLSKDLILTDRSDVEHDFSEHVINGAHEALEYIGNTEWLYISQTGTQIRVEDGTVVEMIFNYVP